MTLARGVYCMLVLSAVWTGCCCQVDVSLCPCDLTGNVCNINCCCDPDCLQTDIDIFDCLPSSTLNTINDRQCYNENVFLFCVYFDNDVSRNYYINPSLVTTETELLSYAEQYSTFSFQSSAATTLTAEFKDYYQTGDALYVVFPTQSFSYLGLPTPSSASPTCLDSNPAAYLIDTRNECSRNFANLQTECTTNVALQASTFYENLRVVTDPFLLKAFNSSTGDAKGLYDLSLVTELYNNNYTLTFALEASNPLQCISNGVLGPCAFTSPPATPAYDAATGICSNALTQVHYRFDVEGQLGVRAAFVRLVYSDIGTASLTQTFSTSFATPPAGTSADPVPRSGNPGYDVGLPVLAGVLNRTADGSSEYIQRTQLGLVRPSVTGDCLTAAGLNREPVLFGQDMRTGCFIRVTPTGQSETCRLLQQEIISTLEGFATSVTDPQINAYARTNLYLAMFGNSVESVTGDWVRVLDRNRPDPPETVGSRCLLSLGMNLQILYANVGSLANPQPKVIGAAFVYDEAQEVEYQCSGAFCQPGTLLETQPVEISSSVSFIDVSQLPEGVEGEYPTFAVRLPYDFFYPFLN